MSPTEHPTTVGPEYTNIAEEQEEIRKNQVHKDDSSP